MKQETSSLFKLNQINKKGGSDIKFLLLRQKKKNELLRRKLGNISLLNKPSKTLNMKELDVTNYKQNHKNIFLTNEMIKDNFSDDCGVMPIEKLQSDIDQCSNYVFKAFNSNYSEPPRELYHMNRNKYHELKQKSKIEFLAKISYIDENTSDKYKKINPYMLNKQSSKQRLDNIRDNKVICNKFEDIFPNKTRKDEIIVNKEFYNKNSDTHLVKLTKLNNITMGLKVNHPHKFLRETSIKKDNCNLTIDLSTSNAPNLPKINKIEYKSNNLIEKLKILKLKERTEGKSLELMFEIKQFIIKNNISEGKIREILGY